MKKAAYGFGGLVVLLVAAALIVPSLVDWNSYKAEIAQRPRKQRVGRRNCRRSGTRHSADTACACSDVRFANVSGSTAPPRQRSRSSGA